MSRIVLHIRPVLTILLFAAAMLAGCFAGRGWAQSDLQAIRRQVAIPDQVAPTAAQEEEEDEPHHHGRNEKSGFISFFDNDGCDDDDDDDDDDDSGLSQLIARAATAAITSPFWVPHRILETDNAALQGPLRFNHWPYAGDSFGAMAIWDYEPDSQKSWLARTSFEYLDPEGGEVYALGGRVLLDSLSRFGLDTSFNRLREELPGGATTDTWIGDANLVFRFAQSQSTQFRAGVGVNWLHDSITSGVGFNLTYGIDLFSIQPLHFASEIDWGQLGHTHLFHGRVTAGLLWRNVEIYTGYDYLSIGQPEFHSLLVGTSIWF